MSCGAFKTSSNLLGRKREMEELEEACKKALTTVDKIQAETIFQEGIFQEKSGELENVKSDLQKKYLEENTAKIALKQLEGKKEELYESSADMNLENRQLEEQIHELRDSLAAIAGEMKRLEQENTDRNEKIESDSAALEQAKADRDNASAALSEVQLEAANLKQQDSFLDQNIHRLEEEKNRLLTEKMSLRDGHTDSKNEVEKRLAQIEELKQKIENAGKDAETYYQEMTAAQDEKAAKNEAQKGFFEKREEASFNTVMLSISDGLIILRKLLLLPEIPPCSNGTPSSTIRGSLLAFRDAPPRTRMVLPAEAEPLLDIICTPETLPLINCSGEETRPLLKSFDFTVATEPVRSLFLAVPYPMTTTSASALLSDSSFTFILSEIESTLSI